jgi:8-oxo-dGTP pyrophosphatase MutT (NUDIX family)
MGGRSGRLLFWCRYAGWMNNGICCTRAGRIPFSPTRGKWPFPGGAVEADDPDVAFTALREAYEEIGLIPDQVKILGRMPNYFTISDYLITPVVGRVPWPFDLVLSTDEVMSVFTIPLDWLTDPSNWQEKPFTRPDGRQEMVIFYETYSGELLWGITARITRNFLEILGLR